MKKYKFDDTIFSQDPNSTVPIRITEGIYEGLVYQYGTIKFEEEKDNLRCNFTYTILEKPKEINEDQELVNYLGEILVEVLNDEIEETTEDFLREGNIISEDD